MELAAFPRLFRDRASALSAAVVSDLGTAVGAAGRQRLRKVLGIEPVVGKTDDHPGTDTSQPNANSRDRLVALHVDTEELLCRTIEVPRAVADRLDAVLPLNLGNWTPFTETDVVAAARRVDRPDTKPDTANVQIELRCAPRSLIDEKIAHLTSEPDAIHLGGPEFDVRRNTPKRRRLERRLMVIGGLLAVALVQVAALSLISAIRQADTIAALETRRSELTRALRRNLDETQKAEKEARERSAILERLDERHSVSFLLRTLASALPQTVALKEFEFSRERGGGTLVLSAPRETDIAGILASTRLIELRNLAISAGAREGESTFMGEFALRPTEKEPVR